MKLVVIVGFAYLSLIVPMPSAAPASTDDALLLTLRDLRAATLRSAIAGHGEATIERRERLVASSEDRNVAPHHAVFRFSNGVSSLVEFAPDGKGVFRSFLWDESSVTNYYNGGPPVPSGVNVRNRAFEMFRVDLSGFSFADIGRIPHPYREREFFNAIVKFAGEKVERVGHLVRLHEADLYNPPVSGLKSDEYTYDFDMLNGGMIVRYLHIWTGSDADKNSQTINDDRSWLWARDNGHIIPRKYEARESTTAAGAPVHSTVVKVDFTDFGIVAPAPPEPSIDDLHIPVATIVQDDTRGLTWKYFQGSAATAPVGKPGSSSKDKQ